MFVLLDQNLASFYLVRMNNEIQTKPLLTYSREELESLIVGYGFKPFHARQIYSWIYNKNVIDFNEMTDLSKVLRALLIEKHTIGTPFVLDMASGSEHNSAVKFLYQLEDDTQVETVYIPSDDRTTVCLSSQVGCAFGCTFCATGKLGLTRNMSYDEIVGTLLALKKGVDKPISNVVFMGMGEPLANLKNVMRAWDILTDPNGIGLSKRKVTISTVGMPDKIRELAEYPYPPKLVFSIASPHEKIRQKVLPVAGRFSLDKMHQALSYYSSKTRNRITVALLVADGFNDTIEDAKALHRWIRKLPVKINLLRYNDAAGGFRRAKEIAIEAIAAELVRLGHTVILRRSRGSDVAAACGQLAATHIKKS